ncbi:hypothetical protein B7P43_G17093 [Cryptotermes secundus]|uniref:Uncharacterized protein n=1 Tax=Cryptotermes secundus TaxID=105785 RepID=A0A2J7Q403_9NEOP|nr:hypothetical protein B7P43_G17093 [Cryptotermes secundus]
MYLREIGWDGMDWIDLAQDWDQWRALVNTLLVLAAVTAIGVVTPGAAVDTEYNPNPQYSFAYKVQDALTGDSKGHQESRNGDYVQGVYYLVEPDGTRRIVEYTAAHVNGFNAVVRREPVAVHAPVAANIVYGTKAYYV